MNFFCNHCGQSFSVTKEQFGTRGKCPHCRATLVIPRLVHGDTPAERHATFYPLRWMDRIFAGMVAVVIHLFVLAALALAPWRSYAEGLWGQGEEIQLGVVVQREELAEADSPWRLEQVTQEERNTWNELASDGQSTLQRLEDVWQTDRNPGAIGGGWSSTADHEWRPRSSLPAGAADEFGILIAQLQADGLDLVITFDSTASMGREIEQVKRQIERIGSALLQLVPKTRIGLCTYRDHGDEYVVKGVPLTNELGQLVTFLESVHAAGGGDEPEAVDEGLAWSIQNNEFRRQARKIILLFGDAPPHSQSQVRCLQLASDFRRRGGTISTVTCRKPEPLPSFVEISQLGGGEAYLSADERQIVTQLMVLIFGSQHREKVVEMFKLIDR
ncbi:MAG TPA: vWA domain-containing protein [Pirellulaceae bacterium]|nr:vWA domain-containing protein [Pirellulaceae bacterium]